MVQLNAETPLIVVTPHKRSHPFCKGALLVGIYGVLWGSIYLVTAHLHEWKFSSSHILAVTLKAFLVWSFSLLLGLCLSTASKAPVWHWQRIATTGV